MPHHNGADFAIGHFDAQHVCRMHSDPNRVCFHIMAMAAEITNNTAKVGVPLALFQGQSL